MANKNVVAAGRIAKIVGIGLASLMLAAAHPGTRETHQAPKSVPASSSADIAAPEATVSAFHAALTRGDTAEALSLLAEDALIFESGGVERGRSEYASHHLASDAAFSAAVQRTLIEQKSGGSGDMAWVTSVESVVGTFRSRPVNSRSVETMLLRRIDGNWRIVHIHWSSAAI